MNLTDKTIRTLQNFSQINNSIYFKRGNVISTISVTNNIFAKAEISEDFPIPFAIYDLRGFLTGVSLFDNPQLEFPNESYMIMRSGKSKVKYFFADPDVIAKPPEKEIQLPQYQFKFKLPFEILERLIKASRVFNFPDLCLESENGTVSIIGKDRSDSTSNAMSHEVGSSEIPFKFHFKIENIKMLTVNYDVEISQKVARFINTDEKLEYFIALEPDSTFG